MPRYMPKKRKWRWSDFPTVTKSGSSKSGWHKCKFTKTLVPARTVSMSNKIA